MQGVPSVIRLKKQKPNEDVRNLFDRKTYAKDNQDSSDGGDHGRSISPKLQNIDTHRYNYDTIDDHHQDLKKKSMKLSSQQQLHDDENVQMAIDLRNQKQKHTDFFFKLAELKERIEVYNEVFRSKKPKYLHSDTKLLMQRMKEREMQRQNDEARQVSHDGTNKGGSRVQSPFTNNSNAMHGKFTRQKSMTNKDNSIINKKMRKSMANANENSATSKLNLKQIQSDQQQLQNNNITEAGEDEEQNSPTSKLEGKKHLDSQQQSHRQRSAANQLIRSQNMKENSSIQQQHDQDNIIIPNDKAHLPKLAQTEKRLTSQHKQSMEKALENQRKQEQQTTNRLNAIEKKMPPVMQQNNNISSSYQIKTNMNANSKFSSTLYSTTNTNHQSRSNFGVTQQQQNSQQNYNDYDQSNSKIGLGRFINQSQSIVQANKTVSGTLVNRNRSQNNLKMFNQHEIDKNHIDPALKTIQGSTTTTNKEAKTLLQSQSYADFKSIYKKDNLTTFAQQTNKNMNLSKNNINTTTQKDRSILMKSVYENNQFKEHFNNTTTNAASGSKKNGSGPFNVTQNIKKKKGRSKSPNPAPVVDTTTNVVREVNANEEIEGISPIINNNKSKKLPPVTLQSKPNFAGLSHSSSQPHFMSAPPLNDTKIKQISALYNLQGNTTASQQQQQQFLMMNNSTNMLAKQAKKSSKNKKIKGKRSSVQIQDTTHNKNEDNLDLQNVTSTDMINQNRKNQQDQNVETH